MNSSKDLQELTQITQGKRIVVERVRMVDMDIAIEGSFETFHSSPVFLPTIRSSSPLPCNPTVRQGEGAIFGVSCPTIKSRTTLIANALEFVENNPAPSKSEILERLQGGDITAEDAIREMEVLQWFRL